MFPKDQLYKFTLMSGIALFSIASVGMLPATAQSDDTDVKVLSRVGDCPFVLPNQDQKRARQAISECRRGLMNAMLGVTSRNTEKSQAGKVDDAGARFLNAGRYVLAVD